MNGFESAQSVYLSLMATPNYFTIIRGDLLTCYLRRTHIVGTYHPSYNIFDRGGLHWVLYSEWLLRECLYNVNTTNDYLH